MASHTAGQDATGGRSAQDQQDSATEHLPRTIAVKRFLCFYFSIKHVLRLFILQRFFSGHLCAKNRHALNANNKLTVNCCGVNYKNIIDIITLQYYSNRKSPDKAALDPLLIL